MAKYEVVLSPAAWRAIRDLRTVQDRDDLADCLGKELDQGPNAENVWVFQIGDRNYTATPLTFRGWVAIHRPLSRAELDRLGDEQGRRVESMGFLIHDLLPPHTAFEIGPYSEV
ncbi:hypothetical protein [Couchioplanes caeruleus]|uniref:Uncharacterized protein n=2 Tax=Couchioplanes caeruleus TaxID=56438 RepID=A0A1K0FKT9_9ACTN|nr:hypothetical protein [Couchioplanes caeruleus]OJF13471.1 hypothetical protein BG844_15135 [Couchioplanes caeruleus subsp. caeruleus]ROP33338.1 hypothetical protein EDD30_6310 [Couchioplanes caeruleus]